MAHFGRSIQELKSFFLVYWYSQPKVIVQCHSLLSVWITILACVL